MPAYAALQGNGATAQGMMGALLGGVSTRQYEEAAWNLRAILCVYAPSGESWES